MSAEIARVPERGLAVIVHNEAAGWLSAVKKEELVQRAQADLRRQYGWEVQVMRTRRAGHEADLAAEAVNKGADIVFAGGGDGTASNMLPALEGERTALGILPYGTINIIAREFGIPVNSPDAVSVQLNADVRQMDVGVINNKHFRTTSGVGFDGSVMPIIDSLRTRRGGKIASVPPAYFAACALMYPFAESTEADITVDGQTTRSNLFEAWTGNTTLLAYMRLREGWVDDGLGELTVFPKLGPLGFVTSAVPALWRHVRSLPAQEVKGADYYRGSNIIIETRRPTRAVADGEVVSRRPRNRFTIEMRRNAVLTVVPDTKQAQALFKA